VQHARDRSRYFRVGRGSLLESGYRSLVAVLGGNDWRAQRNQRFQILHVGGRVPVSLLLRQILSLLLKVSGMSSKLGGTRILKTYPRSICLLLLRKVFLPPLLLESTACTGG